MRKIFTILFCLITLSMNAVNHYVATGGGGTGTIGDPFGTLTQVNAHSFAAGDSILFNRGDTFYGGIVISNEGSAGSPIVYGHYGTGALPIITGLTTISAWTDLGSNIWESTNAVSTLTTCHMVVINDVNTPMGREPNTGYLTFQSHSGTTSITSNSLTGTPDWTGAEAVIRPTHWILDLVPITDQSTSTLTCSMNIEPFDGFGFFIQNDSRTLDQQNEWYYNPTTKKIKIYSISEPTNVKIASVDNLVFLDGFSGYHTFDGINFIGSNGISIENTRGAWTQCVLKNCSVSFSGAGFTQISGSDCTIDNNTFTNSNNNGVNAVGNNSIITNNTIQNVALFPGMGQSYPFGISSALAFGGEGKTGASVENNTLTNLGYIGISFYGDNIVVKNNFINTFCTILDDGGGIYTYTGGRTVMTSVKIEGNIVFNGIGAIEGTTNAFPTIAVGVYCDENSKNVEIFNNSIANCSYAGLYNYFSSYINSHNNTVYNCSSQQQYLNYSSSITNNNNIYFSKSSTDYCFKASSGSNDIPSSITSNNNYYVRPIDDNKTLYILQPDQPGSLMYKTLAEWKTFSSQDANSLKSPIAVADTSMIDFYFNETLSNKVINLPKPMMDVTGIKYASSITLLPFRSVVLLEDPNPSAQGRQIKYNGKVVKHLGKTVNKQL